MVSKEVTITLFLCSTKCPCAYILINCMCIKIHSINKIVGKMSKNEKQQQRKQGIHTLTMT